MLMLVKNSKEPKDSKVVKGSKVVNGSNETKSIKRIRANSINSTEIAPESMNKPTRLQRKQNAQRREKEINKKRLVKMIRDQISTCDYQMAPGLNPDAIFSQQQIDEHMHHCTVGCKTKYMDQDIKSVSRVDRKYITRIGNDSCRPSNQQVLIIEFMDQSVVEIMKQHNFFVDPETDQCIVSGNLSCPKCDAILYCRCEVCEFVPDDVMYYFSRDKYLESDSE